MHYFWELEFEIDTQTGSVGPILAETSCKYKAPLTFPDTILVGVSTDLQSIDEYSMLMRQAIFSEKMQRVAAESTAKIVAYDFKKLQKTPITTALKEKIIRYEHKVKS